MTDTWVARNSRPTRIHPLEPPDSVLTGAVPQRILLDRVDCNVMARWTRRSLLRTVGVAGSVGAERVRSGDHWLTDVMVGGALGYFIGRSVSTSPSNQGVSYTPVLGTDRVGLRVHF